MEFLSITDEFPESGIWDGSSATMLKKVAEMFNLRSRKRAPERSPEPSDVRRVRSWGESSLTAALPLDSDKNKNKSVPPERTLSKSSHEDATSILADATPCLMRVPNDRYQTSPPWKDYFEHLVEVPTDEMAWVRVPLRHDASPAVRSTVSGRSAELTWCDASHQGAQPLRLTNRTALGAAHSVYARVEALFVNSPGVRHPVLGQMPKGFVFKMGDDGLGWYRDRYDERVLKDKFNAVVSRRPQGSHAQRGRGRKRPPRLAGPQRSAALA